MSRRSRRCLTTKELIKSSSPTPLPSIRRSSSENSKLKQEGKVTQEDSDWLYPTVENVTRMYCTPKIHKTGNPLLPIVDYMGSIGYRISRALTDILAPPVGRSDHHLNNFKHLAKEMISVMVEEEWRMRCSSSMMWYHFSLTRLYIWLYKLSENCWKGIRSFIQERASP